MKYSTLKGKPKDFHIFYLFIFTKALHNITDISKFLIIHMVSNTKNITV